MNQAIPAKGWPFFCIYPYEDISVYVINTNKEGYIKITKFSFVVVLAIVLFSGCELIGDAVGAGVP